MSVCCVVLSRFVLFCFVLFCVVKCCLVLCWVVLCFISRVGFLFMLLSNCDVISFGVLPCVVLIFVVL